MSQDFNLSLHTLTNPTRPKKRRKLLGRGIGSGLGKTCGRGHKGAKARSGYKRRYGKEGGGVPLYRRIPTRGFSNDRFCVRLDHINLSLIEKMYEDGEVVSLDSLAEKSLIKGQSNGVKILGNGSITKKVKFEDCFFSKSAKEKLEKANISIK